MSVSIVDHINRYRTTIQVKLASGVSTEHSFRGALEEVLTSQIDGITVINEPKRAECGAPDYIVRRRKFTVGHIEAKDVGSALDAIANSPQLKRYRKALPNLLLTDYLEFRWFVDGDLKSVCRLADWDGKNLVPRPDANEQFTAMLADFASRTPQKITTPKTLAERLAKTAHIIRDIIVESLDCNRASTWLQDWRKAFAQVLIRDLADPKRVADFADMFAQTLAYGLFTARIMDRTPGDFTRDEAQNLIPKSNPFLRRFFGEITGVHLADEPFAPFVDDLVAILANTDIQAVLRDFGKHTRRTDPIVHFYETFLAAYDPKLKKKRGEYYTPDPVVEYIVQSVDKLLKSQFSIKAGLADSSKTAVPNDLDDTPLGSTQSAHRVLVLDPATGTGTFLYHVIDFIRRSFMDNNQAGMWPGYVREHLLPRIHGFELVMTPYAVAHFKLSMQLAGLDLPDGPLREQFKFMPGDDERLRVYLTNTLEEPHEHTHALPFTEWISTETNAANDVKLNLPIMCIVGNPPYAGHSANKGGWIQNLLRGKLPKGETTDSYYEVDGHPLNERNPKYLQDDYVKFIRFSQWRIDRTGIGILGFITNNGYLDNPTFRGMRQSLLKSFSDIYILNLHGSNKKKETTPDGDKDENVFDIQQGVAIGLFVKRADSAPDTPATVHYADLWGRRAEKYAALMESDVESTDWQTLNPNSPQYLFVLRDTELQEEYETGWKLDELMPVSCNGFKTHRDDFAVAFDRETMVQRIEDLRTPQSSDDELHRKYGLRDNRDWQLADARKKLQGMNDWQNHIIPCLYRPFDIRWCFFDHAVMDYPRRELLDHVAGRENLCLLAIRQMQDNVPYSHVLCTDIPCVDRTFACSRGAASVFPMLKYGTELFAGGETEPNFANSAISEIHKKLGADITPWDIVHYIYAVLHAPSYRERYADFLKTDFPRVPFTSDRDAFNRLCELGEQLVAIHLMTAPELDVPIATYPVNGSNSVEKTFPKFTHTKDDQPGFGRVYINRDQYFGNVPESVWSAYIGGYQPAEKWLKDRRDRTLSHNDLTHYHRILTALNRTQKLMEQVDTNFLFAKKESLTKKTEKCPPTE